jgi:hypothetical protein
MYPKDTGSVIAKFIPANTNKATRTIDLKRPRLPIKMKVDNTMNINPRYSGILMSFIIAFGMSFVMSFVMVAVNIGFSEEFIITWTRAWIIGLAVGFPSATLIVPLARKAVLNLTSGRKETTCEGIDKR